jgi:hypothetical protein
MDFLLPYSFPPAFPDVPPIHIPIPPPFGFISRMLPTRIIPRRTRTIIHTVFIYHDTVR